MARRMTWAGAACLLPLLWFAAGMAAAERHGSNLGGSVRIDLGGATLENVRPVVVYLESVGGTLDAAPRRRVAEVHQRNARFSPGFLAITVGQTVSMLNDDAIYHNVFSFSKPNDFDLGVYPSGQSRSVTFEYPGVVRTYCSFHESMNGTIFVAPSPYFDVVKPSGDFAIRDVPPGRYRLKTWSWKLPETSREITLAPGARLSLEIPLGVAGSRSGVNQGRRSASPARLEAGRD